MDQGVERMCYILAAVKRGELKCDADTKFASSRQFVGPGDGITMKMHPDPKIPLKASSLSLRVSKAHTNDH